VNWSLSQMTCDQHQTLQHNPDPNLVRQKWLQADAILATIRNGLAVYSKLAWSLRTQLAIPPRPAPR
jgi:hypothetical protein